MLLAAPAPTSVDDGFAVIDAAACMNCSVCIAHCPHEILSLHRDRCKGEPLEIQKLITGTARFTEQQRGVSEGGFSNAE